MNAKAIIAIVLFWGGITLFIGHKVYQLLENTNNTIQNHRYHNGDPFEESFYENP